MRALEYASWGWKVFPCKPGEKIPAIAGGYKNATDNRDVIETWWRKWPKANIGVSMIASGLMAVDVDAHKEMCGWDRFVADKEMPETLTAKTPSGGIHYVFRVDHWETFPATLTEAVDIKHDGYILVEPSVFNDLPYQWDNDAMIAEVPGWIPRRLAHVATVSDDVTPKDVAMIKHLLKERDNDLSREDWVRLALSLKGTIGDEVRDEFIAYSYKWDGTQTGDPEKCWDTARPHGSVQLGTAIQLLGGPPAPPASSSGGGGGGNSRPLITERSVSKTFVAAYEGKLKWDFSAKAWFYWNGERWTGANPSVGLKYTSKLSSIEGAKGSRADQRNTGTARFASAVERLAKADDRMIIDGGDWDPDPMLLGVPGGVLDLHTGKVRDAQPGDLITKQARFKPEPGAMADWLKFLDEVTQGDQHMARLLQQWFGLCLTGETNEHKLLFIYGPGGNGKSVFTDIIRHILGDYAVVASPEMFARNRGNSHPEAIARLAGSRFVIASETNEGQTWDEARLKQLTGGEAITARRMYAASFDFTPQFKLTFAGNFKPSLRSVDDAIKRRFIIVPFLFKPDVPDRDLLSRLMKTAPAIMQWAVDGLMDWRENGLIVPDTVKAETNAYFEEQDEFAAFLETHCVLDPLNKKICAPAGDLFRLWQEHADGLGEWSGNSKAMGARLSRYGLKRERRVIRGKRMWVWPGIRIIETEVEM